MNFDALKAEMILQHVSQDDLRDYLGISRSAFYRKMVGKTEFTHDEISKMIQKLKMNSDKAMSIFFEDKVS